MSHNQEQLALLLARKLLKELAAAKPPSNVSAQAATVLKHFPSAVKIDLLYVALKKTTTNELQ